GTVVGCTEVVVDVVVLTVVVGTVVGCTEVVDVVVVLIGNFMGGMLCGSALCSPITADTSIISAVDKPGNMKIKQKQKIFFA
ncbi:MAG: hypothetical protein H7839_14760, partial [Magnetococcus sp. YQC-5]